MLARCPYRYTSTTLFYKHLFAVAIVLFGSGILALSTLEVTAPPAEASATPNATMVAKRILIATTSSEITPTIASTETATTTIARATPKTPSKKTATRTPPEKTHTIRAVPSSTTTEKSTRIPTVPFFSQFVDISAPKWRGVGCGIASLAMIIEYYHPGKVSVDTLLSEGIEAGAFLTKAGWTYAGLIGIARKYGIAGESHDLGGSSMDTAFADLLTTLKKGPVMASVHYKFDPKNPIPHLVVINGIKDNIVYYNDPAGKSGGGSISLAKFQSAWKKRYIELSPA